MPEPAPKTRIASKVGWVKFTVDMFDDEKIKIIQSMPEGESLLIIWVRLICMAGKCNDGGYIYMTEAVPYTVEMLATVFSKPPSIIRMALETFRGFDMIEMDNRGIVLVNWEKHQNIEGLKKIQEQNRRRQANFKAKRKALAPSNVTGNVSGNVTVTLGNGIEVEVDVEGEEEVPRTPKESTNPYTPKPEFAQSQAICAWCEKPKTATSGTHYLLQQIHNRFKAEKGECPLITPGKDGTALARITKSGQTDEQILARYDAYLMSNDKFVVDNGWNVTTFQSRYNGLSVVVGNGHHTPAKRERTTAENDYWAKHKHYEEEIEEAKKCKKCNPSPRT